MRNNSIKPGQVWLDTSGNRIQAHGGSVFYMDGIYYWYGENKEKQTAEAISGIGGCAATLPGTSIIGKMPVSSFLRIRRTPIPAFILRL